MNGLRTQIGWFRRLPQTWLSLPSVFYSGYVALGLISSAGAHYLIHANSDRTAAWITDYRLFTWQPNPSQAFWWSVAFASVVLIALEYYFRKCRTLRELVFWGMALAWSVPLASQVVASSVTKLVYEATFCIVGLGGFIISRVFMPRGTGEDLVDDRGVLDPWKTLAAGAKVGIALLALLAGTIATTVVSTFEDPLERGAQINRQILLLLYTIMGLTALAFPPLLISALEPRPPITPTDAAEQSSSDSEG